MKISLDRVDARGLRVDLPGASGESIAITSATGLAGTLEDFEDRLVLSGVSAEAVELAALRVVLSGLVLSTESAVTLTGVALTLEQAKTALALDVTAASLLALDLNVAVDDVVVRGRATLTGARLSVRDDEGSLSAAGVELRSFLLRIGDLEMTAEALTGISVQIAWGAAGFRLVATSIDGPSLLVTAKDVRVDARGVALGAFSLADGAITIGTVVAASARTALSLAADTSQPASPPAPPPAADLAAEPPLAVPLVDYGVLDGLSGELDVDVLVDVTVPIIGHRKATHRLRVPIADGAIDFRALERNLANLEDALLDFSVREGALVLERANPLFPVRGHGKPIVQWDVDALDHELAERDRVRLAVLPTARFVGGDAAASDEPSSFALRELGLLRINATLALAAIERPLAGPLGGQVRLRRVGSLVLAGNVFHDPAGVPRDGSLLGELTDLAASIVGLSLGTSRLDITSVAAAGIAPVEVAFAGAAPKAIDLGINGLRLEKVTLHDR